MVVENLLQFLQEILEDLVEVAVMPRLVRQDQELQDKEIQEELDHEEEIFTMLEDFINMAVHLVLVAAVEPQEEVVVVVKVDCQKTMHFMVGEQIQPQVAVVGQQLLAQ